jgi:hypothetical protein
LRKALEWLFLAFGVLFLGVYHQFINIGFYILKWDLDKLWVSMLNNYQQFPVSPVPYSSGIGPNSPQVSNPALPDARSDVYEPSDAQNQTSIPKKKDNTNLYLGLGILGSVALVGLCILTKGKSKKAIQAEESHVSNREPSHQADTVNSRQYEQNSHRFSENTLPPPYQSHDELVRPAKTKRNTLKKRQPDDVVFEKENSSKKPNIFKRAFNKVGIPPEIVNVATLPLNFI